MNGMHDMGGMQTFGPVPVEDDGKVFHEPWEGRVFAISLILPAQGVYNLNEFRSRRERIPPPEYLRSSYFELWLASMEQLLVEKGVLGREELELHLRASRNTGTTPEDIAEALMHVAVYAGVPAANAAFAKLKAEFS